jgi:hypothetical protein
MSYPEAQFGCRHNERSRTYHSTIVRRSEPEEPEEPDIRHSTEFGIPRNTSQKTALEMYWDT